MTGVIRSGLLSLTVLTLCGPAFGQDRLKEAEERRQVEIQRVERLVRSALAESKNLGSKNKTGLEMLRDAKAQVEANPDITKEVRDELLRQLKNAMRSYDFSDPIVTTPGPTTRPMPTRPDPRTDDSKKVTDAAQDRYKQGKAAADAFKDLQARRGESLNRQTIEFMKSMGVPEYRDLAFPKDWVERSKMRLKGIQLTEEEKKIVKALNTRTPIDAEGKTFKEVLEYLKEKTGVPFVVDPQALMDLNITYNSTLNTKLGEVTLRTGLKKILGELGLVYVMKDNTIQITTPARAKELTTVRVYSVADLMPLADMRMPAVLGQVQAYQTLQMLVVMITQSVEPDSWEVNGKGGIRTIAFDPIRFVLIVRQTAEMHYMMGLSPYGR